MNPISLHNLTKEFSSLRRGRVTALQDINLDIPAGSFFVLLGPSGCGKSTLLNLIAGLEKPTTGEIKIGNQLVASAEQKLFLSPRERDIAMVFQSYALYPHMTVAENIGFPLRMAGTDRGEITSRVRRVAETLDLASLLEARPPELSGGQRQRVALGRAIIRSPRALLLDEPLSNLDALLRIGMRAELKEIQRSLGVTTIYVTHDQAEAMSMGDSITVLKDGTVQQTGSPTEIYARPANLFIARFIGSPPANILTGRQLEEMGRHPDTRLPSTPDTVTAALRPEHLSLVAPEQGTLKGKIKLIATLGSESLIYVEAGDKQLIVRTLDKPRAGEGDTIGLQFDPVNLLIFDKTTGERLES